MFEDSLVESTGRIRTRSKRLAVGSFFLQAALIAVLALFPYLYPASLPKQALTTLLIAPPPPSAPAFVAVRAAAPHSESAPVLASLNLRSHIQPNAPMNAHEDDPAPGPVEIGAERCGSANCPGLSAIPGLGNGPSPHVVVAPKPKTGPVRVSAGVATGLLLTPIRPVYPAIAKAAHVQGTVVVEATISKSGDVVNAHTVSGPAMLAQAAIQAIAQAKYQPFKLNGEPVDVETTINVTFTLN